MPDITDDLEYPPEAAAGTTKLVAVNGAGAVVKNLTTALRDWIQANLTTLAATTLDLGGQTDATLSRVAAGELAIAGSRIYRRGNILGSVSQSGGVPTGAIIEQGSNSNGNYVRFADGTQICWAYRTFSYVSTSTLTASWTSPAAFSGDRLVLASLPASSGDLNSVGRGYCTPLENTPNSTSLYFRAVKSEALFSSSSSMTNVNLMAIGRWF